MKSSSSLVRVLALLIPRARVRSGQAFASPLRTAGDCIGSFTGVGSDPYIYWFISGAYGI